MDEMKLQLRCDIRRCVNDASEIVRAEWLNGASETLNVCESHETSGVLWLSEMRKVGQTPVRIGVQRWAF